MLHRSCPSLVSIARVSSRGYACELQIPAVCIANVFFFALDPHPLVEPNLGDGGFMLTIFLSLLKVADFSLPVQAAEQKVGNPAPLFETKTQAGEPFTLADRKGQWTVLFFYPKADTPGCTKQVCTFRDNIQKIRDQGADVFGISADTVEDQNKFHQKHNLNFPLLADPGAEIIKNYGTKMPMMKMSKRWTFVIDPDLKIAAIEKDVDPVKDADRVAKIIADKKKAK